MNFDFALGRFLGGIETLIDKAYLDHPFKPTITHEVGRKYIKIITVNNPSSSRSVWGFVDKVTGDVYKAAGWNAPAKHVRGNILKDDYMSNMTYQGPNYLRG